MLVSMECLFTLQNYPELSLSAKKMVPELRGSGRALQEYLHSLHLLRPLPGFRSAALSFL